MGNVGVDEGEPLFGRQPSRKRMAPAALRPRRGGDRLDDHPESRPGRIPPVQQVGERGGPGGHEPCRRRLDANREVPERPADEVDPEGRAEQAPAIRRKRFLERLQRQLLGDYEVLDDLDDGPALRPRLERERFRIVPAQGGDERGTLLLDGGKATFQAREHQSGSRVSGLGSGFWSREDTPTRRSGYPLLATR